MRNVRTEWKRAVFCRWIFLRTRMNNACSTTRSFNNLLIGLVSKGYATHSDVRCTGDAFIAVVRNGSWSIPGSIQPRSRWFKRERSAEVAQHMQDVDVQKMLTGNQGALLEFLQWCYKFTSGRTPQKGYQPRARRALSKHGGCDRIPRYGASEAAFKRWRMKGMQPRAIAMLGTRWRFTTSHCD
jgi:hypothetical protein